MNDIPEEYYGWWRITETGTWVDDGLDDLGTAMISFSGDDDRLRMHCLIAHVNAQGTKSGVSFMWMGTWGYDQMSGTGTAKLGQDGRLKGRIRIKNGDDSTFVAERTDPPDEPIPDPRSGHGDTSALRVAGGAAAAVFAVPFRVWDPHGAQWWFAQIRAETTGIDDRWPYKQPVLVLSCHIGIQRS